MIPKRIACLPAYLVSPRTRGGSFRSQTHIFYLFEGNIHSFRQIFIDGRPHLKDPDPTWYGDSIGTWDGDTLVVDTIGYNDKFWFDFSGHPHSEQLHTIERITRPDLGALDIETQIIDPVAYTKPFKIKFTATLRPGEELMEYICQENQQDAQHLQGPADRRSKSSRLLKPARHQITEPCKRSWQHRSCCRRPCKSPPAETGTTDESYPRYCWRRARPSSTRERRPIRATAPLRPCS